MFGAKISIIIPVYNTAEYIERCVRSVMGQSYDNLEIICVNDGSTDGSGEILDALEKEDDRIVVVHKENAGVSAARNEALCHASGNYIAFVDSDDYIDKYMMEHMLNKLCEEKADVVTCGYSYDCEGDIRPALNAEPVPECALVTEEFLRYVYERDIYKGVAGYLWTKLVKRDVIFGESDKPQIRFQEEFGVAEDVIFVAEMLVRTEKIAYLNEQLYYYFQRGDSITHNDKKVLEMLQWPRSYEKVIDMYEAKGWKEHLGMVERMYVYSCGKMLELALEYKDAEKIEVLRKKIKSKLSVYVKTNLDHLGRVKWIVDLMMQKV